MPLVSRLQIFLNLIPQTGLDQILACAYFALKFAASLLRFQISLVRTASRAIRSRSKLATAIFSRQDFSKFSASSKPSPT